MRILVDADACPVRAEIEKIGKKYKLEVILFVDTSHVIYSEYCKMITVSVGKDTVDFALVNNTDKGDIVVTQDYGLAAMVLAKGAYPITQNGLIISDDNLPSLLESRHQSAKIRRGGGRTKGPKKRSYEANLFFIEQLEALVEEVK